MSGRLERADEGGGPRAHHREQGLDRLEHARDPSEGERRRAEPRNLPILWRLEAPDDVDRIAGGVDVIRMSGRDRLSADRQKECSS
jgi:hypothetical protein